MNPNTNDPNAIIKMSEDATRASEIAFSKQGRKPYDWKDEPEEIAPNPNDALLPKTKPEEQFLAELKQEVNVRDEKIADEAAKVVLGAEVAQVYDTTPEQDPNKITADGIGDISKIQEAAKNIPEQDVA